MRKFERNEPYYASRFMLGRLLPKELLNKINLSVYIRSMKHQQGICWAYEKSRDEYTIVIRSDLGRIPSLRAIAHECVHVMQYATGKMQAMWGLDRGKVMWGNRMLNDVHRGSDYYRLPWEKEANAKQERLMLAYLNHVDQLTHGT